MLSSAVARYTRAAGHGLDRTAILCRHTSLAPAAHRLPPTVHSLPPTAHRPPPTAYHPSATRTQALKANRPDAELLRATVQELQVGATITTNTDANANTIKHF
jgi:hypothetical protein